MTELEKKLIERLNASQSAIDEATDGLLELYGDSIKESDAFMVLARELAPNEELLKSLDDTTETSEEDPLLLEAMDKVTSKMKNELEHGEELELNASYTLYKYSEEDIIVINKTEEWEEILQLFHDGNDNIEFESLV